MLSNYSGNIVLPLYLFLPQEKNVFVYAVLTNNYIVLLFSMLTVLLSVRVHQFWLKEYLYSKKDSIYFGSISLGHLQSAFYYLCKSLKAFFFSPIQRALLCSSFIQQEVGAIIISNDLFRMALYSAHNMV